jgi:hypothetical protein
VAVVVAVRPLKVAVITELPAATPVNMPEAPAVTLAGVAEAKLEVDVTSTVVPFEKVAVTASWRVAPISSDGACGATAIDNSVTGLTVRLVLAVCAPEVAVTTVVPAVTPTARPVVALMVATQQTPDAKLDSE